MRRSKNNFSLIHDARPTSTEPATYTQELFAAALSSLMRDGSEPQVEEQGQPRGVQQSDAGAVFAVLLLFHTQRCEPRVQVYVPLGVCRFMSPL